MRKQDPDGPTPKRHWKLDQMEADENHDDNDHTNDREIFLSQLETDREMRSRVNLYKDGDHVDDEDEEGVRLEELLDEMKVEDEVEECAEDSVLEGVVVRGRVIGSCSLPVTCVWCERFGAVLPARGPWICFFASLL